MHWSNGRFHENILVGQTIYVTDHKHVAVFGTTDYTGFGEYGINSNMYGKDITITSNQNLNINSNNGDIIINSNGDNKSTYIKSANYVNIHGDKGITVNNVSYGTSLPTTNNVEGRVFFKLIS